MKKKITDAEYKKLLFKAMLEDFGEAYKRCDDCGKPTHVTYVCRHCGSQNP